MRESSEGAAENDGCMASSRNSNSAIKGTYISYLPCVLSSTLTVCLAESEAREATNWTRYGTGLFPPLRSSKVFRLGIRRPPPPWTNGFAILPLYVSAPPISSPRPSLRYQSTEIERQDARRPQPARSDRREKGRKGAAQVPGEKCQESSVFSGGMARGVEKGPYSWD
jgi:hypothetical protein